MNKIRVLIVDDQTIIRDGLRALLEIYPDIQVVGEASNGEDAYEQVKQQHPDIILMDIRMPGINGVEATRRIKQDFPEAVILILTTFEDDEFILGAMTYGAAGYLLKDIGSLKLIESIREAVQGSLILPGRIASKITAHLLQQGNHELDFEDFTEREREIINLLIQGKSNKEIAHTLYLTIGTVKNYISQIYSKAGIKDRANAVLFFKKIGF